MVDINPEDTVIFLGVSPEITDMTAFYDGLLDFFKKKQAIDANDRFSYILFQESGPNLFQEFTLDYNQLLDNLKKLENEMVPTDCAKGIMVGITFIMDVFRKFGGKCFRLLLLTDSSGFSIPEHYVPIIEDLIDIVKNLPCFIDAIAIGVNDLKESKKILNITRSTEGEYHEIKGIDELKEILDHLAEKKEYELKFTLEKRKELVPEENSVFIACYESIAEEPMEVYGTGECTICFKQDSRDLLQCPNCNALAHKSCWANWAKTSHIGIPHVFRCHNCYYLLMLEKSYVYKSQDPKYPSKEEDIEEDALSYLEVLKSLDTEMEIYQPVDLGSSSPPDNYDTIFGVDEEFLKPTPIKVPGPPKPKLEVLAEDGFIEQIKKMKSAVKAYVEEKSASLKKLTYINTIKAVKQLLKVENPNINLDERIWDAAREYSADKCLKTTPRTIIFKN